MFVFKGRFAAYGIEVEVVAFPAHSSLLITGTNTASHRIKANEYLAQLYSQGIEIACFWAVDPSHRFSLARSSSCGIFTPSGVTKSPR